MPFPVCISCHRTLRLRLHQRLSHLQHLRTKTTKPSTTPCPSVYLDTIPPSSLQLAASTHFFQSHTAQKIWTANEWRQNNTCTNPEVLFIGRSNVGKSSLLNALLGDRTLNRVSRTPGFTKVMHAYTLSPTPTSPSRAAKATSPTSSTTSSTIRRSGSSSGAGGLLTIIDTPGYGHASALTTGHSLTTYLSRRTTLRRVFVLINPSHGLKKTDHQVFELLRAQGISYQIVATKCDAIEPAGRRGQVLERALRGVLETLQRENARPSRSPSFSPDGQRLETLGAGSLLLGEIIATSFLGDGMRNNRTSTSLMQGISALQFAVLRAVGLDGYAVTNFLGVEEGKKMGKSEGVGLASVLGDPRDGAAKEVLDVAGEVKVRERLQATAEGEKSTEEVEDPRLNTGGDAPRKMPLFSVARHNPFLDLEEASRKDYTPFSRRRAVAA
jgi:GTP-binding protein